MVLWVFGLGGLVNCAGSLDAPKWVSELPAAERELCAIGISGPTYYPEDARARSQASAMAELARVVEVRVKSDLVLKSQGDRYGFDTSLNETAGFGSDVMLRNAQVREQWVHAGGDRRYGEQGTVYTLVCMPVTGGALQKGGPQ
ncbi:MAG: LPP20 family lipoprotein [Nitrospiraceae bacterium]